jgi:hypothetical protein
MKGRKALYVDKNFQSSMQSAYEAAVQQAVKDGVITQAQADLILKNAPGMGFGGFREPGGMRGLGGLGGFEGGPGRHGAWGSDKPADSTTPTTP